ncbi:MAG TPA: hypothetical protein DDY31_03520, partial [Lachnospiraceae bacterium]|nr:hypothetical protein [Lachnospiraceae bacterium]
YKRQFGDLEIPCSYVAGDGKKLGVWLNNQKSSYRKRHGLTKEQVQKLEALGICWEGKLESGFERKYQAASEYYREHGNLDIPSTLVYKGESLGKWLNELRLAQNNAGPQNQKLTEEKVQRLNQIGMVWEKKDSWEYRCQLAEGYFREHGDLEISQQYVGRDGIWLGKWLYIQKMQYKKGTLEEWKKERLEEAGICWQSASEIAFEKGIRALEEYFNRCQNADISKGYVMPDGYRLGSWVYRQKRKKRDGKLTGEQERRLTALGVE